ncbi:MAG: amidase family protein [Pirellulaceae bacterium]
MTRLNPESSELPILQASAGQLVDRITSGEWSSLQVTETFIRQLERINPHLNALVVPRFAEARQAAEQADQARDQGITLGPLHGLPVTIKECFHLAGSPTTIGLTTRGQQVQQEDGLLVRRLRQAGAVVLGKTNVPQLMLWHESVNPLFGRTSNPWDLDRGSAGSTGGEAAVLAAYGSPLGLGSDLGGSIRIPAHVCGIHGIKPTSGRLPREGLDGALRGMEAIMFQAGPMGRHVADLTLALKVLCGSSAEPRDIDVVPGTIADPGHVDLQGMKIACWDHDGTFSPAPAIRRAVGEAAEHLAAQGAELCPWVPPDIPEALDIYYQLLGADGGMDVARLLKNSQVHPHLKRLVQGARLSRPMRWMVSTLMNCLGQKTMARVVQQTRRSSVIDYWGNTRWLVAYRRRLLKIFREQGFQAAICPPHALPAMPHGAPIDLLPAASYSFLPNLLGWPAGVVAASRVRDGEDQQREPSRDRVIQRARETEAESVGLPVGVQVLAPAWREDVVLAVMGRLEASFRATADYPQLPLPIPFALEEPRAS